MKAFLKDEIFASSQLLHLKNRTNKIAGQQTEQPMKHIVLHNEQALILHSQINVISFKLSI